MTDTRAHLFKLLGSFENAMLVTHGAQGAMHARPMAIAHLSPGSDAFFITSLRSMKVAEMEAEPSVLVTFQGRGAYATISGKARIVHDKTLIDRYWSNAWSAWFPGGKNDPDICIVAVLAEGGEYWDRSGFQGVKYAFAAAKAYVAGDKPAIGDDQHAKVKL